MKNHAQAAFAVKNWDEKTWEGQDAPGVTGAKLTRVQVTYDYAGDLQGQGEVEYLMAYRDDGTGLFIGLERVTGQIGDRQGSFVLQHNGTFDPQKVDGVWTVVPGSATGDLRGLRGSGSGTLAGHRERYPFALDYDFE